MLNMHIDVNDLKSKIQAMSMVVEHAFEQSVSSLADTDIFKAREVIDGDKPINAFEIEIDNLIFDLLSFSGKSLSPDSLRMILSIQKINPILERIGDHSVNIAESAETLSSHAGEYKLYELQLMADKCRCILHDSLQSFFEKNLILAEDVLKRDEDIDKLNVSIIANVKADVLNESNLSFEAAVEIIRISRNLERIADLSLNIAEESVFSILGRVVKHSAMEGVRL
jgi:phosphate transport system protein